MWERGYIVSMHGRSISRNIWRNRSWTVASLCITTVLIGIMLVSLRFTLENPSVLQSELAPNMDTIQDNAVMTALYAPQMVQTDATSVTVGPLHVSNENPRYFSDANGQIVYLTGSHTWSNLQDNGGSDPPPAFDYTAYLDFLVANGHNFFRLWAWEQARWTVETDDDNYRFAPLPYQRPGPGTALDAKAKFDLTQFNQAYFDRLRARVIAAGERGIYVSVMLFDGWSVSQQFSSSHNPWRGHPFNSANNVNGVDGDPNHDGNGEEVHTLAIPAVTALQEAYVRKVIDTLNDLGNVLYEVSNESHGGSTTWQYHLIDLIKSYEVGLPQQHPVGMTVEWPDGSIADLWASNADWISMYGDLNHPPVATGAKVIVADTDHLCGVCGNRMWVWKSFTRGENPIFMDGYDGAGYGVGGGGFNFNDPTWVSLRRNLGYTRQFAVRLNLAAMTPQPQLASSGYVLAYAAAENAEYLVYLPTGGQVDVELSATPGELNVEWFNPATGDTTLGAPIDGGAQRSLAPPFASDAVLYIYQTKVTPPTYKLMLPTVGSGSTSAEPLGPYLGGQVITLTATPDAGWDFDGWSGDVVSSDNPTTFTISADAVVTATFAEEPSLPYTLTVNTVGDGSVEIDPSQIAYTSGQAITLTAVPTTGRLFLGWSGDIIAETNPLRLTIMADTALTATFSLEAPHSFFQYLPIIEEDSTPLARRRGAKLLLISLAAKLETYPHRDPQRWGSYLGFRHLRT